MKFTNKWQQLIKEEYFQKGLKMFRENKVPKSPSVPIKWVKKLITQRDWNDFYKFNISYCNLGKEGGIEDQEGNVRGGKIKIGFCIAQNFSIKDCELLTDKEMRIVDLYRRSLNIGPTPLALLDKNLLDN